MGTYPDPIRSRVALIGTSDYERSDKLHNLPAVRNNLTGLQRIFADNPSAVFAAEHCIIVDSPDTVRSLLRRLRRVADTAEDVLVVYYAGHGVLDRNGELHLCVGETDPDPYEVDGTGVPFRPVRQAIEDSPARVRVLILDCCFSGRAIGAMSADSAAVEQIEARGTYILTSCEADRVSRSLPGERYTAFTGELIRLLSSETNPITLRELSAKLHIAMAQRDLPRPTSRADDTSAELVLNKPEKTGLIASQVGNKIASSTQSDINSTYPERYTRPEKTIPSPAARTAITRLTGKVKWWDHAKGFGFLAQSSGHDVYVSRDALEPGVQDLIAGQYVEFTVTDGRRGPRALTVRSLNSPSQSFLPPVSTYNSSPHVGKARVHELAKELRLTSKEILRKLADMGEYVKSASSTVERPIANRLRDAFKSDH